MTTTHSSNSNPHSQLTLAGRQRSLSLHELEAWMPSSIDAISPAVDQLMLHMQLWCCITGEEFAVELALREALNNAVIHGNRGDPNKVVEIRCSGQREKGIRVIVRDEGEGFDPSTVPSPLTEQGLMAEHGRGIHLMKSLMDEVSFQCGGREVHMQKKPTRKSTEGQSKNDHEISPESACGFDSDVVTAERY